MTGEIQHDVLSTKAAQLNDSLVGVLSGKLHPPEAAVLIEGAWEGVGRFAVSQADITGTFCEASTRWVLGSQAGLNALDVLAETDQGPHELHLALLPDGSPNFQINSPSRETSAPDLVS